MENLVKSPIVDNSVNNNLNKLNIMENLLKSPIVDNGVNNNLNKLNIMENLLEENSKECQTKKGKDSLKSRSKMKNLSDVHEIIRFEKKGTKSYDLLVEVVDHLKNELGYTIVDSFSDSGHKFSVLTKMKKPLPYKKYDMVCQFSVYKNRNREYFTIWDYRNEQPFERNKYCVINEEQCFGFGRYEFIDKENFYLYIEENQ